METRRDRQVIRRRRRLRYRAKVAGTPARPRLCVYRSLNHIYAQVVDDTAGRVIAAASTLDAEVKSRIKNGGNIAAAKIVGEVIAARLTEKGVPTVTFDRGGYQYHGRIKAIADSARAKGLKF
ncbi:MAG: 50S ribosomal protein L18 [Acidobacteria bacterium]|nr:50S ribosomal protein L18 [Acidobacteriota bacterium]